MLLARLWGTKVFTSPVLTGELIKGLAYIMVTSFLLFLLTRFYFRRLRRSWTAYRSLFEDNPAPMFAYAPQTFKIVAVNEAALHQYGYTKKEFCL